MATSSLPIKPPNKSVHVVEIPRATTAALNGKFPEGVTVLVCPPQELAPEFIRLPKAGEICPVSGMPRTSLIDLLKRAGGKVKVSHVRKRGATTGITLINRQSLIDYITSQPAPDWISSDGDAGE